MPLRIVQVVACINSSFLFIAELYPIVLMYIHVFIHSLVEVQFELLPRFGSYEKSAKTSRYRFLYEYNFSFILGKYPGE